MLITKLLLLVSSLYLTVTASTAKNAKASSGLLSSDLIRAMTLYVNDDDINNGVSCAGCRSLLALLQQFSATDDVFVALGQEVCDVIASFGNGRWKGMCHQSMAEHGPTAANALRTMGNVRKSDVAALFCNNVLQVCPVVNPKVDLYLTPQRIWPRRRELIGMPPYEIVHFSDMHIDPDYEAGTSAECDDPGLCCRNWSRPIPSEGDMVQADPFGHPKTCDTSSRLEDSMYDAIGKFAAHSLFAIYTGDIIGRQGWNSSKERNTVTIANAYARMKKRFPFFFPAVGDHDSSPYGSFPLPDVPKKYSITWFYSLLTKVWESPFDPERYTPAYRGRYIYSHKRRLLMVIGINTNLYSRSNLWLYKDPLELDPEGQLQWLVRNLDAAERMGYAVYIVGHMPMGDVDVMRHSSNAFNRIITRFNRTVVHMFFGHTHLDQVQLNYGNNGTQLGVNAIVSSFVAPSITPSHGNPAFKVYKVDERSNTILDAITVTSDVNDPSFKTYPSWHESYHFKGAYGNQFTPAASFWHNEVLPVNWHKLTKLWEKNSTLFDVYWRNKYTDPNVEACDDECRRKEICMIRGGRAEDNCAGFTPGLKLGRTGKLGSRSPPIKITHEQVNSCGASVVFDAFGILFDPDVQAQLRQVLHS